MKKESKVLYRTCMYCGDTFGAKDGKQSSGHSHGVCSVCRPFSLMLAEAQRERNRIIERRKTNKYVLIKLQRVSRRIDTLKNILSFRRYAVQNRGLLAKPA